MYTASKASPSTSRKPKSASVSVRGVSSASVMVASVPVGASLTSTTSTVEVCAALVLVPSSSCQESVRVAPPAVGWSLVLEKATLRRTVR